MSNENKKNNLTLIVPVYNEQDCIVPFINEVCKVHKDKLSNWNIHILFVNDGSTDNTLKVIKTSNRDILESKVKIHYISFSRNFGKEPAIFAGLKHAYDLVTSQYYVVMDVDLQDPPSLLPTMIDYLECNKDYNRVATRRSTRKGEPVVRSFFAKCFYKLINKTSDVKLVDGARDFQIMTGIYVKSLLKCGEYNRFFKGLSQWVGFKTHWIEYENIQRTKGKTKWSFFGLFKYSLEGLIAFSSLPLKMISCFGFFLSFLTFFALLFVVIKALCFGDRVAGWPSTICIILLMSGILIFSIGILGLYLEKAYTETKNRPIYIVEEKNLD